MKAKKKNDKNINTTSNKLAKRNKISKLAKFLVRKKVKMKYKKRISRNLAFRDVLKLVYKRIVPIEKYTKILRAKSIQVCTIQKKKHMRKRSQIKLIFKRKPCSYIKNKKMHKESKANKCYDDTDNEDLNINDNNTINEKDIDNRKYTRNINKNAKYRNITGYKINKVITFYKLCYCKPEQLNKQARNKTKSKRRKRRNQTKRLCDKQNKIIYNYKNLILVDPDKEKLFVKESNAGNNLKTPPKVQTEANKMENQVNSMFCFFIL